MTNHENFMIRALELAADAYGQTSPNPLVGAVVVKNGKIIGEGYHKKAGGPHAEVVALRKAGGRAKGADLYVTLEPCCHYGRTPPCTDLIIKVGVSRVIYGMQDPNPQVGGNGFKKLKKAGINVIGPVLKEPCMKMNRPYSKWMMTGLPYITAKIAITMDGKIADSKGDSKWISNKKSREYSHWLRAGSDVVMVGEGTYKKDKPKLNVRLPAYHGKQPVPMCVSTGLSLRAKRSNLLKKVDLKKLLKELGSAGFQSVLVEGGSQLHSELFKKGLVDYVVVFIAPKLLGGGAKNWLGDIGRNSIGKTLNLIPEHSFMLDGDVVIECLAGK